MYKKHATLLFLLFLSINGIAQNKADGLLKRCILLLEQSNGIQTEFTSTFQSMDGQENKISGELFLKKDRFKMITPRSISWFNGTTLWSYISSNSEVTISEPSTDELTEMNPYFLICNYAKKYTAHYQGEELLDKKKTHCIKLIPHDKKSDFSVIKIYLTVKDLQPLSISSRLKNGSNGWIKVDSFHSQQNLTDSFFEFLSKDYPEAELIDMR